jgi:NAD(P)-dependent dehydrogenase (short-subunit alcohol dehydrogenase family)
VSGVPVALVTGASRGIGRAICIELVGAGCDVYGTGRDERALAETAALCGSRDRFHPRLGDVRSESDVARIVDELPRLDLCFNNAGIARIASFTDTSLGELEEILATNVAGAFLVMRTAAARMVREGGGRIVTIASDASYVPIPGMSAYCASKHAVSALSRILAGELGAQGVQVTTVYPGGVATDILGPATLDAGMRADELARTVVAVLLAAGPTVRVAELHLQPWREPPNQEAGTPAS